MKKTITAAALAVLLAGCATQAKFQTKMDSFVGQPEATLVGTYGPPQGSYALTDGSKVIQYTRGGTMVLPGATTYHPMTTTTTGNVTVNQGMRTANGSYNETSTTYMPQQAPAVPIAFSCTVNFTVDKDGIVRRWAAEGNHCVAN